MANRQTTYAVRDGKRRTTGGIFIKHVVLYVVLILLMAGVTGRLFFTAARTHLEEEVGRRLEYVARIAASHAPFERLELIRVGDDQARMVLRLKQGLGEILEVTGVDNIYVFRPDLSSLIDLAEGAVIGTVYEAGEFTEALRDQLISGTSAHTGGYQTARGDIRMSAYAPVADLDGELFAIVAVDAGSKELEIIDDMRSRLYWITLGCGAAALVIALFFARSITAPIRHIADVAERLGKGDYSARASVTTRDELETLANSVNRMVEQVRKRDEALKEIAASVAHEIRNPLNSINLLISLLDDEPSEVSPEERAETVKTLHYEVGKLNRFIGEFLTYSRPVTLIGDDVPVTGLIANVVEMASAEARDRGVHLRQEIESGVPDLRADRQRLEQSVLNLVINAVQASGEEGEVVLTAAISSVDRGVDLIVDDSGAGIPDDVLGSIYEPFFTTKADGTGLGLANARKIAEEHDCSLSAENRSSGGARFTLHVPPERTISRGEG